MTQLTPRLKLLQITDTDESCTLSLHDALPISDASRLTISRTTRATDASRSATRTIASTYLSGVRAWPAMASTDRKSTRLNSSHQIISYAVFCSIKTTKMLQIAAPVTATEGTVK